MSWFQGCMVLAYMRQPNIMLNNKSALVIKLRPFIDIVVLKC